MITDYKIGDKVWTCLASLETLGYEINSFNKPHEVIIVYINDNYNYHYVKTQSFDQNNKPDNDSNATYSDGPDNFFNKKEEAIIRYKQLITYKIKELKKELNMENK